MRHFRGDASNTDGVPDTEVTCAAALDTVGLHSPARMSLLVGIMNPKAGQPQWMMEASGMTDHNGVLMMQRALLAGTLGLAMAQKAAAILEGEPEEEPHGISIREPQGADGAVLRAILDAANDCLGHFDDRPAGERWCDTLFHLLDLAAFAAELSGGG